MPTTDQKFVQRLDDFTKSLEGIVELLKESVAKGNADNVNEMLTNMNDNFGEVVENIREIATNVREIKNQNDAILREIQEVRRGREAGVFANIAEVDNKKKIVSAIEVIALIAAGVLAIGLAFKLIAPVDFLSVIAVGLAIVFITGAFVAVAAVTEDLTTADVADATGMLILISMTITASSWILALAATLTLAKSMSIIFTAVTLGTSLFLMSKAVENSKLKPEDYPKMALLPLVLPLIALGITLSSMILSGVAELTFAQVLSTIFVAGAIGVALFLISQSLDKAKMEGKHISQILLLPVMVPALAMGIVIASAILSSVTALSLGQMVSAIFTAATIGVLVYLMKPMIEKIGDLDIDKIANSMILVAALADGIVVASWIFGAIRLMTFRESLLLIMTSLAIGLSVLFLAPTVYVLRNIEERQMINAAKNIVILAGVIAVSSWLLAIGTYKNYPSFGWAMGVGISILALAGTAWILNKMGFTPDKMYIAGLAILGISTAIMLISLILNLGKYENYPGLGWSIGVGLTLVVFGGAMMLLGLIIGGTGGLGAVPLIIGAIATMGVAATIAAVSWILAAGNYDKYPTNEWAKGVGLSMVLFGGSMMLLGILGPIGWIALTLGAISMFIVSSTIVKIADILNKIDYERYPTEDWAKGVGLTMLAFGASMMIFGYLGPIGWVALAFGALSLFIIAGTIVKVTDILSKGNYEKYPTKEWAKGVGLTMLAFGASMMIFGYLGPIGWIALAFGALSLFIIAGTIVKVSDILSRGNYDIYPTEEWANGVGLSVIKFSKAMMLLGILGPVGWIAMTFGAISMFIVAGTIVKVADILSRGNYEYYPSEEWAKGVGLSMTSFGKSMMLLGILGPVGWIAMTFGAISMFIVAGTIVKVADILSRGNYEYYPSEEWAKGVGLSMVKFGKAMMLLGILGPVGWVAMLFGAVSMFIVAGTIVKVSDILARGNYEYYPTEEWANGVGLSMVKFGKAMLILGVLGPAGWIAMAFGAVSMFMIAKTIVKVDEILSEGYYEQYPSKEWAKGVGLTMLEFGEAMIFLGPILPLLLLGGLAMRWVASTIASVSKRIAEGEYEVPGIETWAEGITKIFGMFALIAPVMPATLFSSLLAKSAAKNISDMSLEIVKGNYTGGPSQEWADGVTKVIKVFIDVAQKLERGGIEGFEMLSTVGSSIVDFASKMSKLDEYGDIFADGGIFDTFSESMRKLQESLSETEQMAQGLNALGDAFNKIASMGSTSGDAIRSLTKSIIDLSESLKDVDMESIDKLSKFSNGILVLSLIDEKKLDDALSAINQKRNDIVSILSESAGVKSKPTTVGMTTLEESNAAEEQVSNTQRFYSQLISSVQSLDTNVGEILKIQQESKTQPKIEEEEVPTSTPVAGAGSQQTNTKRD